MTKTSDSIERITNLPLAAMYCVAFGVSWLWERGRLSVLLPRIGYRETNRVFLKEFAHD